MVILGSCSPFRACEYIDGHVIHVAIPTPKAFLAPANQSRIHCPSLEVSVKCLAPQAVHGKDCRIQVGKHQANHARTINIPWFFIVFPCELSRACTHWPKVGGALVAGRKRPGDTGDVKGWEKGSNSPGQASQNQLLETGLLDGRIIRIHQNDSKCSFSSLSKKKLRTQMTSGRARALYPTEHRAANLERYTEHRGLPRAKRPTAKSTVNIHTHTTHNPAKRRLTHKSLGISRGIKNNHIPHILLLDLESLKPWAEGYQGNLMMVPK